MGPRGSRSPLGAWVGSELLPGASPLGGSAGGHPPSFARGRKLCSREQRRGRTKNVLFLFIFFPPFYFLFNLFENPPALPPVVAIARLEGRAGLRLLRLSVFPHKNSSADTKCLYTSAEPLREWGKDLSPSFPTCLYTPGSRLHSSGGVKGPVIYCCFEVPPASPSDVKGLSVDSGFGLCFGLASSLSSGVVYPCRGIYAGGKSRPTAGSGGASLRPPPAQRSASFFMRSLSLQSRVLFPSGNNAHCCS